MSDSRSIETLEPVSVQPLEYRKGELDAPSAWLVRMCAVFGFVIGLFTAIERSLELVLGLGYRMNGWMVVGSIADFWSSGRHVLWIMASAALRRTRPPVSVWRLNRFYGPAPDCLGGKLGLVVENSSSRRDAEMGLRCLCHCGQHSITDSAGVVASDSDSTVHQELSDRPDSFAATSVVIHALSTVNPRDFFFGSSAIRS
jgi:hypothetical protein